MSNYHGMVLRVTKIDEIGYFDRNSNHKYLRVGKKQGAWFWQPRSSKEKEHVFFYNKN